MSEEDCLTRCLLSDNMCGFIGTAHGHIISTLIDEVSARTVIVHMGKLGFTTDMSVRYIQDYSYNTKLIAKGRILDSDEKRATVYVSVNSDEGTLLEEGESKSLIPALPVLAKLGNVDESLLQEFLGAYS